MIWGVPTIHLAPLKDESDSANRCRRPLRASQREIEPGFAFDPADIFVVALGALQNDLLIRLVRSALQHLGGARPGRVAKLPTVAVDDIPDQVADDRR